MYFTRNFSKSGSRTRKIEDFTQQAVEWSFLFSRVMTTYAAVIMFLTALPVVQVVQKVVGAASSSPATTQATQLVLIGQRGRGVNTFFNANEVSHLLDVHRVLMTFLFITAVLVVWSVLIERKIVSQWVAKYYRRISVFISVLTVPILLLFPVFFEVFHRLIFPQGNYSFVEESVLIQNFPLAFWIVNFVLLQIGVALLLWWQAQHAEGNGI